MNQPAIQPDAERLPPSPAGGKFMYRTGARPLAGYTIKRGIGSGGFGEVYYATSDGGKEVALKLIRRNLEVELRGVSQCLNLKHPNLLALHDIKQDEHGDSWVVMEYVSGESLEAALARSPHGMSPDEVLRWFRGIAAAVAYLHEHGIVHRDLKPGNIFSDEGVVKVGDYGLSKFISCSRRSGQTGSVGTVHYMAPELSNGRYGKEIDIYALGIILYEMLTGHVPFEGESLGEILMKHLTAQPDVSSLAEPYRGIIAKALAKDPAQRFTSVEEMVQALPLAADGAAVRSYGFSDVRLASQQLGATPGVNHQPLVAAPSLERTDEEPIWRWGRSTAGRLANWWRRANFHPGQQAAVIAGVFLVLAFTAHVWFILLFPLLVLYGVYLLVRTLVLTPAPTSKPLTPAQLAARTPTLPHAVRGIPPRPARAARFVPREQPAAALVVKSGRERLSDLLGSLLMSAAVACVLALVMMIGEGANQFRGDPPQHFVWIVLTATLASWGVLIPASFWHGTRGETAIRRFVMLVVGMGVGLAVGMLHDLVHPLISYDHSMAWEIDVFGGRFNHRFFDHLGNPQAMAFVGFFGGLFLAPRWWRQADPLRKSRISFGALIVVMLWSGALQMLWPMPQPWGVMTAVAISIAVQLSSPWQRNRIATG